MSLQRQHVLLSYFKTPSVRPVWGSNLRPSAQQSGALPTELTGRLSKMVDRAKAAYITTKKNFPLGLCQETEGFEIILESRLTLNHASVRYIVFSSGLKQHLKNARVISSILDISIFNNKRSEGS